jgi:hypothetical protein
MKRFGLLLVVVTLGFMLIQCGGKEDQTASKAPEPAAEKVEAVATDAEPAAEMSYNLENGEAIYK